MLRHRKAIGTVAYMGGIMSVPEPFCFDWANMLLYSNEALCRNGEFVHAYRTKKSFHSIGRNDIVQNMRGDWLLMYDTDLEIEPDATARLVRYMYEHDLDVVSGLYCYKGMTVKLPVIHMWNQKTEKHEIVGDWDRTIDLFEFSSAGAGCLLVRRRLFERILKELREEPFSIIGAFTEDHSFFRRVRQLGVKPFCAWKVACGHLRYQAEYLNPADNIAENYQLTKYPVTNLGSHALRTQSDHKGETQWQ